MIVTKGLLAAVNDNSRAMEELAEALGRFNEAEAAFYDEALMYLNDSRSRFTCHEDVLREIGAM